MVKKEDVLVSAFSVLFIFSILMIFLNSAQFTGYAVSQTTVSNVTISKYLSISLSTNLTAGILFGTVNTLPAVYVNASHNFDGNGSANTSTSFFVNVSTDSNTNVDLCTRAESNLTDSSGDLIGNGNESWANSTFNNVSFPPYPPSLNYTATYQNFSNNVAPGNITYLRFWLNVPSTQAAGTYNNSIGFKGVQANVSC